MNISENAEAILNEIEKKYASIDQKRKHLEGTLVQTNDVLGLYPDDALLNIKPRTTLPDEMVLSCIIK
jgi:tryptophan 2,3-dioxygenase